MVNSNMLFRQDKLDEPIRKLCRLLNGGQARDEICNNSMHVESIFYQS